MDAHLFRHISSLLADQVQGMRVQRIHSPVSDLVAISLYGRSKPSCLMIRSSKQSPLLFSTRKNPLPNPPFPGAHIMRLRKYVEGRRLGQAVCHWPSRRMAFSIPGADTTPNGWLLLDLKNGVSYVPQLPPAMYVPPLWPESSVLPQLLDSLQNDQKHGTNPDPLALWKNYSVLTPELRKTLVRLSLPEAAALLVDLEDGSGDILLYGNQKQPVLLSPWPLIPPYPRGIDSEIPLEQTAEDLLNAAEATQLPLLLMSKNQAEQRKDEQPGQRDQKKKKRLVNTLIQEKERLQKRLELKTHALMLRDSLWRIPANEHHEELTLSHDGQQGESCQAPLRIQLDPRYTVQENMNRFFHQARRAERGLSILEQRLQALEKGNDIFSPANETKQIPADKKTITCRTGRTLSTASGPWKRFISSDGFTMLRGKNAAGNKAILKEAQSFDYWLHTENGPSAHMVIRRHHEQHEIPSRTLEEAGALVAQKSPSRHDSKVAVMYALVKHVHSVKGGPAGAVHVVQQLGVVLVNPAEVSEDALQDSF